MWMLCYRYGLSGVHHFSLLCLLYPNYDWLLLSMYAAGAARATRFLSESTQRCGMLVCCACAACISMPDGLTSGSMRPLRKPRRAWTGCLCTCTLSHTCFSSILVWAPSRAHPRRAAMFLRLDPRTATLSAAESFVARCVYESLERKRERERERSLERERSRGIV